MIQTPPSFIVRTDLTKVASDNGYRVPMECSPLGWLHFRSTSAPGEVWLAADSNDGPFWLTISLAGVAAELSQRPISPPPASPGGITFTFHSLSDLHSALDAVYHYSRSLPDVPLKEFEARTRSLPRTTEVEQLIVRRVGQDVFRDALMSYWKGRCPITGITDPALLRASHIVAWADCETDSQRLDVHNGLLLSALWDAAFDSGLVSFDDDGKPIFSTVLSPSAVAQLSIWPTGQLQLKPRHRANLLRHRLKHGFRETRM